MTQAVLRALVDSSLRSALIAALVAVLLAAFRVRTPGARHAVWTAVLAAMLLLPILPYCVPDIPFPVAEPLRRAIELSQDVREFASEDLLPATRDTSEAIRNREHAPRMSGFSGQQRTRWRELWPAAALAAYGMVTLVFLSRLLAGWYFVRRLVRAARRLVLPEGPSRVRPFLSEIAVYESAWIAAPATVGLVRPATILPLAWSQWPDEKLRAVLLHELAHVRRRDPLVGFFARINVCFFWFHPLAWWLERELAVTAESACDDSAVRALGDSSGYATVLVEIAEAVRRSGRRVRWQGSGIDGRFLARRVARILRGEPVQELSSFRKTFVGMSCGVAILSVASCRPESTPVALQPDLPISETQDGPGGDLQRYRAAREMTSGQVGELEASLRRNPEDLETRGRLLAFYWSALGGGDERAGEAATAARQRHILWLIQNHPESELAGSVEARIFLTGGDSFTDPAGYAEARELWLARTRRPEVSAAVLGNASRFFEAAEQPLAEQLLLRAQAQDPQGPWRRRLGSFYAALLVGSFVPTAEYYRIAIAPESPYADTIRRKLAESTDDVLLTAVAESLLRSVRGGRDHIDRDLLASSYLERALELNPDSAPARRGLLSVLAARRRARIHELLREIPPVSQYETVSELSESDRLELLPDIALIAYRKAEDAARFGDHNLEAYMMLARERSTKYAEDLLQLAPKFRSHPKYGTAVYKAYMTLGSLALRRGDKSGALEHLRRASEAPASGELAYSPGVAAWPLLDELVREGEREPVADFLERMARKNASERDRLQELALQIRRGRIPRFPHWTLAFL